MGLFSKKSDLDNYEVNESDKVEKFSQNGKFYDLENYVKYREARVRTDCEGNKVKIGKNQDKTKKVYLKKKDPVSYIEWSIAKQLAEGAEKCRVTALEVKNNTN
ncbi:MAG: hypothetical protein HFH28_11755 [Clostridiaceae bacterium]|nr:hypothetical protein [Lachnospiraceae bacterium]MCI8881381.1 hypothetical protein [Clostridiaceae bacterium]